MSGFPCVHYIEVGVVDGTGTVETLKLKYNFKVKAFRHNKISDQWLLVNRDTRFLVTCLRSHDSDLIKKDDFVINWSTPQQHHEQPGLPRKDSVFNIAFQVKNIAACVQRLENNGATLVKPLHPVFDAVGSVKTCMVKSCVGDVYHTLVEVGDYPGYFLPGFTPVGDDSADLKSCDNETLLMSFDHVAISVEMNQSVATIEWYEKCFGMRRFLINKEEDRDNGLVLATNNVGLRLRAMEYWKCAEVGLISSEAEGAVARLSLVIAEGLPPVEGSTEENQITSWIRQHGGPGIQHIAISSADIKGDVKKLKLLGAEFAQPPPDSYYTEIGRLHDILRSGEDLEPLREHGILIDTEADGIHDLTQSADEEKRESYLLQIFTRPVFNADPFFLELIQREGATGFGSGNIAALYRSVQAYIVGEGQSRTQ